MTCPRQAILFPDVDATKTNELPLPVIYTLAWYLMIPFI